MLMCLCSTAYEVRHTRPCPLSGEGSWTVHLGWELEHRVGGPPKVDPAAVSRSECPTSHSRAGRIVPRMGYYKPKDPQDSRLQTEGPISDHLLPQSRYHLPRNPFRARDKIGATPEAQAGCPGWNPGPASSIHLYPEDRYTVLSVPSSCEDMENNLS